MDIEGWVPINPLADRRTEYVLQGESVHNSHFFRDVQVGGVDVVIDSNEHLSLTGINHRVLLKEQEVE